MGAIALIDDPRRRFPTFLFALAAPTLAWLWLTLRRQAFAPAASVALGLGARTAFLGLAPAFSDDVFRYLFEGRTAAAFGPAFPFLVAPADAAQHGVPPAWLDEIWLRINHAHLPTIYPPVAQGTFMLAATLSTGLGHRLLLLKALLVAAEAVGAGLIFRRFGPRALTAWALCPLAVLEIAREGHVDALAALGFAIFLFYLGPAKARGAFAGLAVAAGTKLVGVLGYVALWPRVRRGKIFALAALGLIAVPYVFASQRGLGAYAGHWAGGGFAFWAWCALLRPLRGGLEADAFRIVTRAGVAASFAVFALWEWRRAPREPSVDTAGPATGRLLLATLLLSPSVHPWYALWLLPFVAVTPQLRAPGACLIATLPLLHHPGWFALSTGTWTEHPAWLAAAHLPTWLCLAARLARRRKLR